MSKILAFSGSTRTGSFNQKLLDIAVTTVRDIGGEVNHISLRDFEMPLYNGDLESDSGIPDTAMRLKALMKEHQGLLLACPEYNSSITPLLKNTIDWLSRPVEGEAPLAPFTGKVAGLISASPGQLGGLRGLVHVRSILSNIGVLVLPTQVAVGQAHESISESAVTNQRSAEMLDQLCQQLVDTTKRLAD